MCQLDADETRGRGGTDPAAARRVPNAVTATLLHCWAPPAVSCGGIWVLALPNASGDAGGTHTGRLPFFRGVGDGLRDALRERARGRVHGGGRYGHQGDEES